MGRTDRFHRESLRQGAHRHIAEQFLKPYLVGPINSINQDALVDKTCRYIFLPKKGDPRTAAWIDSFETAANILEAAYRSSEALMTEAFDATFAQVVEAYANLHPQYENAMAVQTLSIVPREKFILLLNFYSALYEQCYRAISSIFVVAKKVLNGKTIDLSSVIDADVTTKRNMLLSKGAVVPSLPQLCAGCDRHLRNSIAHSRWKMIDRASIEMTDVSGGNIVWQEKHTLYSLTVISKALLTSVDAMDVALLVMDNNLQTDCEGRTVLRKGYYGDEQLPDILEGSALNLGLVCRDVEIRDEGRTLFLNLHVPINYDVPQVTEIYESRGVFTRKVAVLEFPLHEVVGSFLLTASGPLSGYEDVHVLITDESAGTVGEIQMQRIHLEALHDGKGDEVLGMLAFLAGSVVKVTVPGESQRRN